MKKIVLVIVLILIVGTAFAVDPRRATSMGDFYSRMPAAEAFTLVGDRVLIEKYSGVDYTFYDFGDIKLYISEGVLTGVKLFDVEGHSVLGYAIGDEFHVEDIRREGYSVTNFGGEYSIGFTGVRFFVGHYIYSADMPEDIIYAIQVDF